MRVILFALLILNAPPILSQSKLAISPSKVFVKANDIDCDTDRFRLRMVRELKSHGLVIVEKPSDADFILFAALEHGSRPVKLAKAKINVTLTRRGGTPFTSTTTWSSTTSDGFDDEVQKTAAKNVVELQAAIHTVKVGAVIGTERKGLTDYLSQQGYHLVDSDPDVSMDVRAEKNDVTEEEEFATVRYEVRNPAGELYATGNRTSTDAHFYVEPIDVIASVAIQAAKAVPAKPYRLPK